jgi:penicillin amidase
VRDALVGWDGRMDAASVAAGMFAAWRAALVRRVAAHPVLRPLHTPHGFGAVFDPWLGVTGQVAAALARLLAHPALRDDVEALVVAALDDAPDAAEWGATHRLLALHVLADVPGAIDPGARLDVPLSGDGDAVRCTGSTPGVTDRSWRGSVARWAWDLSDRENSLWSVPSGAAGDPGSPHFSDQLAAWSEVRPTRVVTDWARLRPDVPTGAA